MILVIGLGPIGFNVGRNLVGLERNVAGLDVLPALVTQWREETAHPGFGSYDEVPWDHVSEIIVAVRTAAQVAAFAAQIERHAVGRDVAIFVTTTLSVGDGRTLLPQLASRWRAWESPVSGGPEAARKGTMTLFVAGPQRRDAENRTLHDISANVFEFSAYGQPALVKLLNNALATMNGIATAQMLLLAEQQGVEVGRFAQVLTVSSGRSWASDNFLTNFGYELLLKDVRLLLEDIPNLPDVCAQDTERAAATITAARASLSRTPTP